jgi:hypothetical protein
MSAMAANQVEDGLFRIDAGNSGPEIALHIRGAGV